MCVDPYGVSTSVLRLVENKLIKPYVNELCRAKFTNRKVEHEIQDDTHSCGPLILKHVYETVCGGRAVVGSKAGFRREVLRNLVSNGIILKEYCPYCKKQEELSKSRCWLFCDGCGRWMHDVCISKDRKQIAKLKKMSPYFCEICTTMRKIAKS